MVRHKPPLGRNSAMSVNETEGKGRYKKGFLVDRELATAFLLYI